MKLTDLTHARSLRRNLAVVSVLALTPAVAHADLIGDEVMGAIVGGPGAFAVDPPTAIVGGGIEFFIEFLGTPAFSVDIGAESVFIDQVFGAAISTGAGEHLVLSDLDWQDVPGSIIGIANFESNQPGITESDVTWTADSVTLNMSPVIWSPDAFVSWDLVVEHVPAPSALALIGMAGLIGRRRRR